MARPRIAELIDGVGRPYLRAEASPCGRFALVIASNEVRMSHWIESAALFAMPREDLVAELGGSDWSLSQAQWSADDTALSVILRRYPGDAPPLEARLDLVAMTASVDAGTREPLSHLSRELERWYQNHRTKT